MKNRTSYLALVFLIIAVIWECHAVAKTKQVSPSPFSESIAVFEKSKTISEWLMAMEEYVDKKTMDYLRNKVADSLNSPIKLIQQENIVILKYGHSMIPIELKKNDQGLPALEVNNHLVSIEVEDDVVAVLKKFESTLPRKSASAMDLILPPAFADEKSVAPTGLTLFWYKASEIDGCQNIRLYKEGCENPDKKMPRMIGLKDLGSRFRSEVLGMETEPPEVIYDEARLVRCAENIASRVMPRNISKGNVKSPFVTCSRSERDMIACMRKRLAASQSLDQKTRAYLGLPAAGVRTFPQGTIR